jgi:hypothetical protein
MEAVSGLRRLVAAFHRGGPVSLQDQSMWDMWYIKRQWNRFLSEFFDFSLSVSFHRGYSYNIWGLTKGHLVAAVQRHGLI